MEKKVFFRELKEAGKFFKEGLAEIGRDDECGKLHFVGNSHIDVSWLWTYAESIRKCSRTFSSAIRMLEKYPEYIFSCSQPHLFLFVKENHPDIYEQIKKVCS